MVEKELYIYSGASPKHVADDLKPLVELNKQGMSLGAIQKLVQECLLPHLMRYDLPGFQSMFNAFPEPGAKYGAEVSLQYNQGVTNWQVSPGGAMLEEMCCRSMCNLFGFLPSSDATFMYSGTYANMQALYLALHQLAELEGFDYSQQGLKGFEDSSRLVVLTSKQAHFSLKHAVRSLGLGDEALILIDVDNDYRMDVQILQEKIKLLKGQRKIISIVATAGTTSTGSIDPLHSIVDIARRENIWLHIDGAYGLAYSLIPEWKPKFSGMDLADSVSWDPHKQLRVPIPNSILFLRNGEDFQRIAVHSDYFNRPGEVEPNPGLKSPPSTRPLAALPLVTSLLNQGVDGLVENLRAPLKAIIGLAKNLDVDPDIELAHFPETGILCFRIVPTGFPVERLDQLQEKIYQSVIRSGKRTISITTLNEVKFLRIVAISPSVTIDTLMDSIQHVRALARDYLDT